MSPTALSSTGRVPPNTTLVPLFLSTCHDGFTPPVSLDGDLIAKNESVPLIPSSPISTLLQTLHNYPNLILWMRGIVTSTPSPRSLRLTLIKGPEFGFWEVETASLRDFPQQFRTFKIVRNDNNTVSIFITDVDPAVQEDPEVPPESPAAKSRGYAIGANRISAGGTYIGLTDTTSHVYNAELIKPLATPYTITVNVTGPGTVAMQSLFRLSIAPPAIPVQRPIFRARR